MYSVGGHFPFLGVLKDDLRIVTVAAKKGEIATSTSLKLVADYGFSDCPPLDLLVIPGGFGVAAASNQKMSLHGVGRLFGTLRAERIADAIECKWHRDASWDPFLERAGRGR